MTTMFGYSVFNQDVSSWNVSSVVDCNQFDYDSNPEWNESHKPNFTNCNPD